jgi:sortase A
MTTIPDDEQTAKSIEQRRSRYPFRPESAFIVAGLAVLAFCAAAFIQGRLWSRASIRRFHDAQETSSPGTALRPTADKSGVDFSLWSDKRIAGYKESLAAHFDAPLAVLRIDKIHLEVPVLEGTDDWTLNRGVGRISGTSPPGGAGNIGIAGHRDGFFRGLKDVQPGDRIVLETQHQPDTYVIDKVEIVAPNNTSVLLPTSVPSITLVTCYPFYFIGSAPQRYIVHASLTTPVEGMKAAR